MGDEVKEEEMEVKSPPVLETITWTSVFALNAKKKKKKINGGFQIERAWSVIFFQRIPLALFEEQVLKGWLGSKISDCEKSMLNVI